MNLHNNEAGRRVSLIIVSQLSSFLVHIYKNHHETVGTVRMPTSSYGQCYCSKANLSSNQRWHFDNWVEVFLLLLHSPSHCPYPCFPSVHLRGKKSHKGAKSLFSLLWKANGADYYRYLWNGKRTWSLKVLKATDISPLHESGQYSRESANYTQLITLADNQRMINVRIEMIFSLL